MNIIEALNGGKVVFFKSIEPRFYKKKDGKFFYSDDLRNWKVSTIKESVFQDTTRWTIHN